MTNPTLERAARALYRADPESYGAEDDMWSSYVEMARAVLMAVRDQGMNIYHSSDPKSHFPEYEAAEGFGDMIDAILSDGEGE